MKKSLKMCVMTFYIDSFQLPAVSNANMASVRTCKVEWTIEAQSD